MPLPAVEPQTVPTDDAEGVSRQQPTGGVQRSRALALVTAVALIALGLCWELWWAPTGRGTLTVKVVPLVLALPGLWRRRLYTYRWLSLAVWLYVTEGLVRGTSGTGPALPLAWLEVALSLALFTACAWHVRARLRAGLAHQSSAA